jgi:PAS domain S-box-containing protein
MRHRKAERDLHNSETRYRRLFETAQDGILILDADTGEITDANPFLLNIIGYSLEELLGKHLWDIGVFKDIDISKKAFLELQTKKYIQYENLPLQKKNGQEIFVEFVSNVYAVNHTNVIRCDIRDITDRKKAELSLFLDNKKYLKDIFNILNSGMVIIDPETHVIFDINQAAVELIETDRSNIIGSVCHHLICPADKGKCPITDLGQTFDNAERILLTANGRRIPVLKSVITITIKGHKYLLENFVDITKRKKIERGLMTFGEDLERKITERTSDLTDINMKLMAEIDIRLDAEKQLNKTVGEKEVLLREIHHRVKNNLQIIISLLNLQSRYITDEKILAAIRDSQNRVKAMSLVHEKLYQSEDISKINLDDYIRFLGTGLIQFYGAKSRGITLTTDIRDIHVDINAAIPLGLIINELISNSIKYAFPDREKGEIFISVRKENHTLSVLFKDNGVGIPADLDWRNTESLGLRLVISLVEQLNGSIELDRSSGTAFNIVLQEKE